MNTAKSLQTRDSWASVSYYEKSSARGKIALLSRALVGKKRAGIAKRVVRPRPNHISSGGSRADVDIRGERVCSGRGRKDTIVTTTTTTPSPHPPRQNIGLELPRQKLRLWLAARGDINTRRKALNAALCRRGYSTHRSVCVFFIYFSNGLFLFLFCFFLLLLLSR